MSNTHADKREKAHAKLLSYQGRQVLAHLFRDENDALSVVFQLWVAATDEQLRVSASFPGVPEEEIDGLFAELNDEQLADAFERLGVPALIAGAGRG